MERSGYKELDYSERAALARKTLDNMGWERTENTRGGEVRSGSDGDDGGDGRDAGDGGAEGGGVVAGLVEEGKYNPPDDIVRPGTGDLDRSVDLVDVRPPEGPDLGRPERRPAEIMWSGPVNPPRRSAPVEGVTRIVDPEQGEAIRKKLPRQRNDLAGGKKARGSVLLGVDSARAGGDNDRLLPSPVTKEELDASRTQDGRAVINKGKGKNFDFHGDWGSRFHIQSDGVVENLNKFLQDKRTREFFPEGARVRPHPNGDSLVWEWPDAESGGVVRWQQTARPSWQIRTKGMFGTYLAEETPWGFMARNKFDDLDDREKAGVIAHEAYHQMMQIGEQGKVPYLIDVRGQLVVNMIKNAMSPGDKTKQSKKSIVYDSYRSIRQEQEAYKIDKLYDRIVSTQ